METFSLTPFDERYMAVPYEWMEFSFLRFMYNPGDDFKRDQFLIRRNMAEQEKAYEAEFDKFIPENTFFGSEEKRLEVLEHFRKTK